MVDNWEFFAPLVGGVLIGIASALVLLFNGRIAGISGILGGVLEPGRTSETPWRIVFLAGLLVGGLAMSVFSPDRFPSTPVRPLLLTAVAGVIVGFGTRLGSGCTSGHGVCGMSRLSSRSIVATGVFMATGALTVFLVGKLLA